MKSTKPTEQTQELKQPATIKVKTLIIAVTWFATIVATAIAMWFYTCNQMNSYNNNVKAEASALIQELSKTIEQK